MAAKTPGRVVFIRHGESVWNVTDPRRGLVSRYTGWADISLTDHGRRQAAAAGRCLKQFHIRPDAIYTSLLQRSKETAQEIGKAAGGHFDLVPVVSSWRLNERHYGALVGLPKDVDVGYDRDLVMGWRRSWDKAPPPMSSQDIADWKTAQWAQPITIIKNPLDGKTVTLTEKTAVIPLTESLKDCAQRVKTVWMNGIAPRVARGETVLVVAHANSIRSLIRSIDHNTLNDETIRGVHIPSATPLVYTFTSIDLAKYQFPGASPIRETGKTIVPAGVPSKLGMTGRYVATREILQLNLGVVPVDEDQQVPVGSSMFDLIDKGLPQLLAYADQDRALSRNRAILVTDGRGVILHANAPWRELTGFTNEYMKGRTCKFLQGPLTSSDAVNTLNEKLRTGLPAKVKLLNYRMDGSAFEASLTIIPVFDWLSAPAWAVDTANTAHASLDADPTARARELRSRQALDYGGDFYGCSAQEKDRIVMNPSHFVAKLEVDVPAPPSMPRQGENDLDFDPEEVQNDYPALTPQQLRQRDNATD